MPSSHYPEIGAWLTTQLRAATRLRLDFRLVSSNATVLGLDFFADPAHLFTQPGKILTEFCMLGVIDRQSLDDATGGKVAVMRGRQRLVCLPALAQLDLNCRDGAGP